MGVEYSAVQLTRILRSRLQMHFGKPFPHDYHRPEAAEALLQEKLGLMFTVLKAKGLKREEIAIGRGDETSSQNRANAVRFWSLEGHPKITRDTTHFKSNTIGCYAMQGTSAQAFLENSKEDSMIGFLRQIRAANETYRAVVVVLDNYVSHKSAKVLAAANELGIYLLHLPPYSPDLNPTEYIWKSMRRVLSKRFIKRLEEMKAMIVETWGKFAGSLSFGEAWIHQFLEIQPYYSVL